MLILEKKNWHNILLKDLIHLDYDFTVVLFNNNGIYVNTLYIENN